MMRAHLRKRIQAQLDGQAMLLGQRQPGWGAAALARPAAAGALRADVAGGQVQAGAGAAGSGGMGGEPGGGLVPTLTLGSWWSAHDVPRVQAGDEVERRGSWTLSRVG